MVQKWRESSLRLNGSKPSQNQLDEVLEQSRGTWAQIESGKLHPPDRELCDRLDAIRDRAGTGSTWRELAPARLHRLDPALAEWHDTVVAAEQGLPMSEQERQLFRMLQAGGAVSGLLESANAVPNRHQHGFWQMVLHHTRALQADAAQGHAELADLRAALDAMLAVEADAEAATKAAMDETHARVEQWSEAVRRQFKAYDLFVAAERQWLDAVRYLDADDPLPPPSVDEEEGRLKQEYAAREAEHAQCGAATKEARAALDQAIRTLQDRISVATRQMMKRRDLAVRLAATAERLRWFLDPQDYAEVMTLVENVTARGTKHTSWVVVEIERLIKENETRWRATGLPI